MLFRSWALGTNPSSQDLGEGHLRPLALESDGAGRIWVGSVAGYEASIYWRAKALILNACFFYALGIAVIAYFADHHKELSWCDRLFGFGSFGVFADKFENNKVSPSDHRDSENKELSLFPSERDHGGVEATSSSSLMVLFRVPEHELMKIFDDLKGTDGRANQRQLSELLASAMMDRLFEERSDKDDDETMIRRQDWHQIGRAHV